MNDPTPDILDRRVEFALRRLPRWEPATDFAPRLAAAAARQAQRTTVSPTLELTGNLLLRLSDATLVVIAALTVAGLLVWAVPWGAVVEEANLLAWTSAVGLGTAGLWTTFRTLAAR